MQDVRASEQGKFEERMPFVAVRLPSWFSSRYPAAAANLRLNSDRLTTPFDIHETMIDVLDMQRLRNTTAGNERPRAYSLFQDIPDDRTCADAAVEPHWLVYISVARVCNIRPLFQIRIFGYFSRQIRISGFYPDFLVQVRIGPYIPFSNCK